MVGIDKDFGKKEKRNTCRIFKVILSIIMGLEAKKLRILWKNRGKSLEISVAISD
jgi:hypothetical protein